jgi:hypothetical protein
MALIQGQVPVHYLCRHLQLLATAPVRKNIMAKSGASAKFWPW